MVPMEDAVGADGGDLEDGGNAGGGDQGSQLPETGSAAGLLAPIAGMALLGGGAAVAYSRRKKA